MKKIIPCICLILISLQLFAQNTTVHAFDAYTKAASINQDKVLSGKVYELLYNYYKKDIEPSEVDRSKTCKVFIYMENYPDKDLMAQFTEAGIILFPETWTPPVGSHPLGFIGAEVYVHQLPYLIETSEIKKIHFGGHMSRAMNNTAGQFVGAPLVWSSGNKGQGKKICILDSGIDISYAGTDLPAAFQFKDYSDFPNLDDDVANTVTGHGTHVTATALGRGILSQGQDHRNNGKGPFYGIAPEADLIFLKIGRDKDARANDLAMIAAIDAAVNTYDADIISLSYGGWDEHLDGTYVMDQKADWAFHQGVPFFTSGGNAALDDKHWKGMVPATGASDFIEIYVEDTGGDSTMLYFNMVWRNNAEKSGLMLQYFDENKQPLDNVVQFPATTSPKGTHSRLSYFETPITEPGTYYLKIINQTSKSQEVHLYEYWYFEDIVWSEVYFREADPGYTIGSPATAENVFAVGAYVSKPIWTSALNGDRWWGPEFVIQEIATFSSHGPTMDERIKPDLCAPGHVLISLRDLDVYKEMRHSWVDNDGIPGGDANYYSNLGTSMACPVVAGAAALYLEKYPDASPRQLYDALKRNSDRAGQGELPNNVWGHGKLKIDAAIQGAREPINIDGIMTDQPYKTLATYTSGRNGYGDSNNLGEIRYFSDGKKMYIGITGEVTGNDNILLFFGFSGVQGKGQNILGGGHPDNFVYCAFSYLVNVTMDFDVSFALGFNKGNSEKEMFCDAIHYGAVNNPAYIGKTNQSGGSATYDLGTLFGGSGNITFAYNDGFSTNQNKGVEMTIDLSAFAGVGPEQTVKLFAVISSMTGDVSNECIPGDPGPNNPGNGANFAIIPNQDFFTQPEPFKVSGPTTLMISNEEPGFLIDKLISQGHGDKNLYETIQLLKPSAGDAIPQAYLDELAGCPAGSEAKQVALENFSGMSNAVGINTDCSFLMAGIKGKDYQGREGWVTYPIELNGIVKNRLFTYASNPVFCNDTGVNMAKAGQNSQSTYKAFAIAWSDCNDITIEEYASICEGDTHTWQGNTYTETGQYSLTMQTAAGCDSTLVLNLQVHPHFEDVLDISICQGDAFTWRGNQYTDAGTYTEALQSVFGCDSTYVLNLQVNPTHENVLDISTCQGDAFAWRGNQYTETGQYREALQTINGCDSVFVLNLQVNPTHENVLDIGTCQGDAFVWRGNTYTETGQYREALQTINGCDSVFVLNLQVNPTHENVLDISICQGDSFAWRGNQYTDAGTYSEALQSIFGCDSTYVLNLSLYPVYESVTDAAICRDNTYSWQGNIYAEAGQYREILQTINGCDSILVLNLSINPWYYSAQTERICHGETFSWQGDMYSDSGTYTKTLQTINGCDSIRVLHLNVFRVDASITSNGLTLTAGLPDAGYQWVDCNNSFAVIPGANSRELTATSNGSYAVIVTQEGCSERSECLQVTQVGAYVPHAFENIRIYPNPTNGTVTIRGIPSGESWLITITDLTGRIIFRETISDKYETSALKAEPAGMYILQIRSLTDSTHTVVVKTDY